MNSPRVAKWKRFFVLSSNPKSLGVMPQAIIDDTQKARPTQQDLRRLRTQVQLAKEMGESVGRREVLQRQMPQKP